MHSFPVVSWNHLNRVPGATVKKGPIWTLTNAFLAAYTQVWIYFDTPERRMVFVGHPEHASFDGTVLDASW